MNFAHHWLLLDVLLRNFEKALIEKAFVLEIRNFVCELEQILVCDLDDFFLLLQYAPSLSLCARARKPTSCSTRTHWNVASCPVKITHDRLS